MDQKVISLFDAYTHGCLSRRQSRMDEPVDQMRLIPEPSDRERRNGSGLRRFSRNPFGGNLRGSRFFVCAGGASDSDDRDEQQRRTHIGMHETGE